MEKPQPGDIGSAWILDPRDRNPKLRPVLVLSVDDSANEAVVAAISTAMTEPLPEFHIPLPWHRRGHPKTGLRKRSVVKCDWQKVVSLDEIESIVGRTPDPQWRHVIEQIRKLAGAE